MASREEGVPIDPNEPGYREHAGVPLCRTCGGRADVFIAPPGLGYNSSARFANYRNRMRQLGEVPVCSCSPPLRELSRSGGIGRDKRYVGGHLYDARAESRSADDRVERWESVTEEIWQLEQLRRKGVLTDAEFKKAKRKVIGGL